MCQWVCVQNYHHVPVTTGKRNTGNDCARACSYTILRLLIVARLKMAPMIDMSISAVKLRVSSRGKTNTRP